MEFFKVLSLSDVYHLFSSLQVKRKIEKVSLDQAVGRVLASNVQAKENWPLWPRATMDGYAVRAKDTFGASETNPAYLTLSGEIKIDEIPDFELQSGECVAIVTGALLPKGADSVLMVEYSEQVGNLIEVKKSLFPQENIVLQGEDFKKGERVLESGKRIGFREIGALATLGWSEIEVFKRIRVGIISTGDELVKVDTVPQPGQVRDVNSFTLNALLLTQQIQATIYEFVPDRKEALKNQILTALHKEDVVLLSGGSSVGTRDLTLNVLQEIPDSKVLFHGLALSPGKPTMLAKVGEKFIFGLPGQVTSAQIVFLVVVNPFLRVLEGEKNVFTNIWPCKIKAVLDRNISSKQGRYDFVRVRLSQREQRVVATPILGKSGLIKTLFLADGLLPIADNCEGIVAGREVEVWLLH
ncbi:molybdopterin molybdotransferase MoeA [Desulfonauticus submarinus]